MEFQATVGRLMKETAQLAVHHPSIFLYLIGYYLLNFFLLQPYLSAQGQTPLLRSIVNISLSLLLFFAFVGALICIITHTYALAHDSSVSLQYHLTTLRKSSMSLLAYLLILGAYLAASGALSFFIAYKVALPADVSFAQLLGQISAAGQTGLAQPTINFLIVIAIAFSICIMTWMLATFFVLPLIVLDRASLLSAFRRSLNMTKTHAIPVITGTILAIALLYLGDYLLSFVRQPALNGLYFYLIITLFVVYSTLVFITAKKNLFTRAAE